MASSEASAIIAGNQDRAKRMRDSPSNCNDSAAHRARTTCTKGNQRKLQRKTPAVGTRQRMRATTSRPSSQLMRRNNERRSAIKPAASAIGGTKPQASSVAVCGIRREEKSAQLTVHFGITNPGRAENGTRH